MKYVNEWFYIVSDDIETCSNDAGNELFEDDYVLIARTVNKKAKEKPLVVNDDYVLDVLENLKVNMKGNGDAHHGSVGYYHGFGVVAKYGIKNNLSIGTFSEYKGT